MRTFSCDASRRSKRQRVTEVAFSEKRAKFTPFPSQVAPSGDGYPNQIFTGVIKASRFLSATAIRFATLAGFAEVKVARGHPEPRRRRGTSHRLVDHASAGCVISSEDARSL